jgi:hypothetical protein
MRALKKLLLAAGVSLLLCTTPARAASDEPDFEFSGRFNLEWEAQNSFRDRDLEKEAVLGLETRRRDGWKGYVEARLSSGDLFTLRELFLDYRPKANEGSRERRLIIGQDKKRFGLEWDLSQEDRIALSRGAIYRKLAAFSFVGRDSQIAYRFSDLLSASIHTSDGLNAAALVRSELLGDGDEESLVSSSLLQSDRIDRRWHWTWAQALSYSRWKEGLRYQAEGFVGLDSLASDLAERQGDERAIHFAALTAAVALQGREERSGLAPFVRGSLILNNLGDLGEHTFEAALGARYYFIDRLHLGGEIIVVRGSSGGVSQLGSATQGTVTLRYYFNGKTS